MTKNHIEFILSGYGVPYTDALADKLLEMFDEEAASYLHTINELNKALSENKGEWIPLYPNDPDLISFECKSCGEEQPFKWNFCPNCGADMRPEPYKAEREVKPNEQCRYSN